MKSLKIIAITAALTAGITGAASANSISYNGNPATVFGGDIIEGGPLGVYDATPLSVHDFNTSLGSPVITVTDSFTIFGSVTNQNGSTVNYVDGWTMDFGAGVYDVTFNYANALHGNTDGIFSVGGVDAIYSATGNGNGGSISLFGLTGLTTFLIDPINDPTQLSTNGTETISWNVEVAAVPLPAGAVLLLGALGGLAAMRRRNKAA